MSVKHALWIGATLLFAACDSTTEPNVVPVNLGGTNPTPECRAPSPIAPTVRSTAERRHCQPTQFSVKALPR